MVADAGALEALERNLWSMWRQFGQGPGCSLIDEERVLRYETPITVAPYNMVLRFRGGPDPERDIAEILTSYRSRGADVVWLVHPTSSPDDLREHLSHAGLVRAEMLDGMACPLETLAPPPVGSSDIAVDEVTSASGAPFVGLVSWRYDLDEAARRHVLGTMESAGFGERGSPNRAWVATIDDEPAAKITLHVSGEVAGVYGLATTPDARGRGLGTLLTCTAFDRARAMGATTAVLHSTPMAVDLYRRLGFEHVADFELWAEPDRLDL